MDELFNYLRLFRNIAPEEQALIRQHSSCRKVKEGEILLREGLRARELFFISDGILKIVSSNAKGQNVIKFFLKQNQFCTILNSFDGEDPAAENIAAACDSSLVVFQREDLLKLYAMIPYFKELIEEITQHRLMEKIAIRNSYIGEEASVRYRKFLMQQADIALRVSLTDIASYLGITPQSLSRLRKKKA